MSTVNFTLDINSKVKLYHQLYTKFADAIDNGEIPAGTKLPSVRNLSEELKISKNTVTKAYKDLGDAGYLYSLAKSGFYAKHPDEAIPEGAQTGTESVPLEHQNEQEDAIPTVDAIIRQRQSSPDSSKSVQSAIEEMKSVAEDESVPESESDIQPQSDPNDNSYLAPHPKSVLRSVSPLEETHLPEIASVKEPVSFEEELLDSFRVALMEKNSLLHKRSGTFGDRTFRTALAGFMYNFHHITVDESNLIVGSCIEQLLYNVLRLKSINEPFDKVTGMGLLNKASRMQEGTFPSMLPTVAIAEDPNDTIRHVFMDADIQVKEIPVDDAGLNMDYLVTSGCNLVFVSADDTSLGDKVKCDQRKAEILSWASGAPYRYIIEFDTDTNKGTSNTFKQYDLRDKVIYLNSFRHLLDKGINSSWIVLPKKLAEEYTNRYTTFDCTLSYLDQLALTDFIISGKLENFLVNLENI